MWGNRFLCGMRDRAHAHLADQGDGNHFAYVGEVDVTPGMLGEYVIDWGPGYRIYLAKDACTGR